MRGYFLHADHPHGRGLGAVDAGSAGGGRDVVGVEERPDLRQRHQRRLRRRGEPATIDDLCTAMPTSGPARSSAAAPEKPSAGARLERACAGASFAGAVRDRVAAGLRLRIGDADQRDAVAAGARAVQSRSATSLCAP